MMKVVRFVRMSSWKSLIVVSLVGLIYSASRYYESRKTPPQSATTPVPVVSIRAPPYQPPSPVPVIKQEEPIPDINNPKAPIVWPVYDSIHVDDLLSRSLALEVHFATAHRGKITPLSSVHLRKVPEDLRSTGVPVRQVLIFTRDPKSAYINILHQFFSQQKIKNQVARIDQQIPSLFLGADNRPLYTLIVFDDYFDYLQLDPTKRGEIDSYCRKYFVGILGVTQNDAVSEKVDTPTMEYYNKRSMVGYRLNQQSSIAWRIARPEKVFEQELPTPFSWTVFVPKHKTYRPLAFSTLTGGPPTVAAAPNTNAPFGSVVAIHDTGLLDGVERVIFGNSLDFWLNTIVATDVIYHLSHGRLSQPLERYIQVDIDDMFVGDPGLRTTVKDAEAMVASQQRIQRIVPGFRYFLGFSGERFGLYTEEERQGAERIIELKDQFPWFNHMYTHLEPHTGNLSIITKNLEDNIAFAKAKQLNLDTDYMVCPHHAGVYPVLEDMYEAWSKIGITATSTIMYPHLHPQWKRLGFIYRGVMVVPRQTCGLYTYIVQFDQFPGGKAELDNTIQGGSLFKVFLHTPILMFMTHMTNFANGQLGQYVFENAIQFVSQWTKLKLLVGPPVELARKYFNMYPEEREPVWTDPCSDPQHQAVYPPWKRCGALPDFIITGPRRTGTTALDLFLSTHPGLRSGTRDGEIQFFNTNNYFRGLDWYQNHFAEVNQPILQYEKCVDYFDSDVAPKRIHSLLPKTKVILTVSEPVKRAYSCYRQMHALNDSVAVAHSFYEIVSTPDEGPKPMVALRDLCLQPGLYALHLARYLYYFSRDQIVVIDGDQFLAQPAVVLNGLQSRLKIQPFVDYNTKLSLNPQTGMHCLAQSFCIGENTRSPTPMDNHSAEFLAMYYKTPNLDLKTILTEMKMDLPAWLINLK